MYTYITDSLFFYQKNKDFIYKNDLFKWTLKHSYNELKLHKKIIDKKIEPKLEEEIIGIISPSNYRLLFDLKELNLKKIYYPELYNLRKEIKIDYKKIDELFEQFLKRSYLSFLNYEKLQKLGLNRIEQYLIILNIIGFANYKNYDNLMLNKNFYVREIKEIKIEKTKQNRISLLKAIRMISLKYDLNFDEASKFLIQQYGKLTISDPFHEDGFMLLKKIEEYPELNNIFITILKKEIEVKKYKIIIEDIQGVKKEIEINSLKEQNSDLSNYFGYQEEEYFEGKYISPINTIFNIEFIYQNLMNVFPVKDYVLTLKSLYKLDKINIYKNYISINKEKSNIYKIKSNYEWISKKTWKNIYELKTFSFNNILDEINIEETTYKCPCCGEEQYHITPMKFYCKNRYCKFIFDRLTLKIVEVKPILEEKMKEALIHKKVFVRNKNGKNFIAYLRNNDNYFYLSLK